MRENGRHRNARTLLHKWGMALELKVRRCSTALSNTLCRSDAEMPRGGRPVFYQKHCAIGVVIEEHSKGPRHPRVIKWHGAQYEIKWITQPPTELSAEPVKIKSVDAWVNGEVALVNGAVFFNPQKKTMFDYSAFTSHAFTLLTAAAAAAAAAAFFIVQSLFLLRLHYFLFLLFHARDDDL